MIRRFFIYACEPRIEDMGSNWSTSYANKLWYWICYAANPLTMCIDGLLMGLAEHKKWIAMEKYLLIIFIIMVILFIINVIQRCYFESQWEKIEKRIFKDDEKFRFISQK